MTSWYKNWFDSKYYHILYNKRNHDEAELFINNLLKFLSPTKKSYFLDLCCGKGRHSILLNKMGYRVDGIDLSKNSIKQALREKKNNLNFFVRDMRLIREQNKYNFILNLFTSFGYFNDSKDNHLVINGVSKALKKNGIFIIDFLNIEKTLKDLNKSETIKINEINFYIKRWSDLNFLYKKIEFKEKNKKFEFTERIQLLNKEQIVNLCSKSNLKNMSIFGDYQLNDFNENSERLILLFKK
ncbi:MAG: SAM-dependent methyltransferase [Flavobacteriales bacterium]|nr:SAM-dependent methyltransferase [Flavobacteriales bacterium]|tara:strand:+ start:2443 stop:3165 length:723 start_codon:yes stop_codon:yes gene_type:complete